MTVDLTLTVLCGVLVAAGVTLLLERTLTRILLGVLLMSNGINLAFLVASGRSGAAPVLGSVPEGRPLSDPLPMAMVLTAIVITLGVSAFLLALAYRAWQLEGDDEVQDDLEDAVVARLARLDEVSSSYEESTDADAVPDEEVLDS